MGRRHPSMVQAGQELRNPVRRLQLSSRVDDTGIDGCGSGGCLMSDVSESAVRAEVGEWLRNNWDPELGLLEWRNKLVDSGWGAPHWPARWHGRDLPVAFNTVVDDELNKIGAVNVARAGVRNLVAATILAHGTD